ncbi:MAG: HAD family hydrolase [Rhizobiales bacterium]|nr:HAD family hydrolase [Hyphomicrobiales bacterium]
MPQIDLVFLVDVDNTLIDNDAVREDFRRDIARSYGTAYRDRYWAIQEELFVTLGYRDYLGAAQQLWLESGYDMQLLSLAAYLLDYPFARRLYPGALEVLRALRRWGSAVILTDGDAIFQPRKIERAGIAKAVDDRILIFVHKEDALDDIRRRYPARHYVLIDDKPRILSAFKASWGRDVTTIWPRQGQFASDPAAQTAHPAPDLTILRIGDLLEIDLEAHLQRKTSMVTT